MFSFWGFEAGRDLVTPVASDMWWVVEGQFGEAGAERCTAFYCVCVYIYIVHQLEKEYIITIWCRRRGCWRGLIQWSVMMQTCTPSEHTEQCLTWSSNVLRASATKTDGKCSERSSNCPRGHQNKSLNGSQRNTSISVHIIRETVDILERSYNRLVPEAPLWWTLRDPLTPPRRWIAIDDGVRKMKDSGGIYLLLFPHEMRGLSNNLVIVFY